MEVTFWVTNDNLEGGLELLPNSLSVEVVNPFINPSGSKLEVEENVDELERDLGQMKENEKLAGLKAAGILLIVSASL